MEHGPELLIERARALRAAQPPPPARYRQPSATPAVSQSPPPPPPAAVPARRSKAPLATFVAAAAAAGTWLALPRVLPDRFDDSKEGRKRLFLAAGAIAAAAFFLTLRA